MSKNLETEYKDLMQSEATKIDAEALWSRIEAALPEKETSSLRDNNIVSINSKPKWYKSNKLFPVAGTIVAACILMVLLLPGVLSVRKKSETASEAEAQSSSQIGIMQNMNAITNELFDACESEIIHESEETHEKDEMASEQWTESNKQLSVNDSPTTDSCEEALEPEASKTVKFVVKETTDNGYLCSCSLADDMAEEFVILFVEGEALDSGQEYEYELVYDGLQDGLEVYKIKN